ncbi:hypothetical protein ISP15_04755 [Dyella jejuensis]|uniref:Uncharacterized protein n=1 Tax=Dyella jejuensis TaxID=1432009 RepID=A0ABW8JEZ4_9GAMM
MNISNISSTQSQPVSGLVAAEHARHKKALDGSTSTALMASTDSSATTVNPLASAVAAALSQLGLTFSPHKAGSDNAATPLARLPRQLKASQQVQQYRNIAATFSNLAQALNANSSSAVPTSSGATGLTSVFQDLWASLGSSSGSGTPTDSSNSTIPSLQSFLQTLAHNFSESGISDLRGVFVDTIV